jgi:hypothetical protein
VTGAGRADSARNSPVDGQVLAVVVQRPPIMICRRSEWCVCLSSVRLVERECS